MKKLILFSAFILLLLPLGQGQNISINTTGAAAVPSAMLDITSTNSGLLIPRVSLTSTTDAATILTPATSLLVYNLGTGGLTPSGYFYNSGTSVSPLWVQLLNGGSPGTAWLLKGNTGITTPVAPLTYGTTAIGAAENWMGTTDARDIVFGTDNRERMRILKTSGNVGIGTALPIYPFHLKITDAATANVSYAMEINHASTGVAGVGFGTGIYFSMVGAGSGGVATFDELGLMDVRLLGTGTNSQTAFVFSTQSGGVFPIERLRVTGGASIFGGTTDTDLKLSALDGSNTTVVDVAIIRGLLSNATLGAEASAITFHTRTAGGALAEKMRINNWGDVGIGTSTPAEKLHVVGNIKLAGPGTSSGITMNTVDGTDNSWLGLGSGGAYNNTARGAGISLFGNEVTAFALGGDVLIDAGQATSGNGAIYFRTDAGTGAANLLTRMTITNAGNVGIGCTTPQYALHVIGDIASSATIRGVNAYVTGAITACSDIRYKKDITPLYNSLDNILKLQGVNYFWKKEAFPDKQFNDSKQIGIIAQELEKVYPEMVVTDKDGYKSVDYSRLTPILIEAIKEQQKIIGSMQLAIGSLKSENSQIIKRFQALEAAINSTAKK